MWMACYTQEEIAERESVDPKTVREVLGEMADLPKLPKSDRALAEHAVDFDPPMYNIWKQQQGKESSFFVNQLIRQAFHSMTGLSNFRHRQPAPRQAFSLHDRHASRHEGLQ
jgi:hypothetical protein